MKQKDIFRILSILIMGDMYLVIIFRNLPFPFSSPYLYFVIWITALIMFHPILFILKPIRYVYFYIFTYLILILMGIYNVDYQFFLSEILPVFIAITIYLYFLMAKDYKGLAWVISIAFIFMIITSFTSIIGLMKYPMAARDLAGKLSTKGMTSVISLYLKMGIAGFGFFTGLGFLFPVFVATFKMKWKKSLLKYVFLCAIVMLFYSLIKSQYGAPLILAMLGTFFALWGNKNVKRSMIILVGILILIFIIPSNFFADLTEDVSKNIEGKIIKNRIYELSVMMREEKSDDNTHYSERAQRIPFLIKNILHSPLIGGGKSTEHVFWLDMLSMFGLIGILPWILILRNQMKINMKLLSDEYKYYYLLSMASFIGLGFMKGMRGREIMAIVFLIIPGFNFLKCLIEPKSK